MHALSSVSDHELRHRLWAAVHVERVASADVVFHLAELDRRKLYLADACSSLFAYCTERLHYSEDSAIKRVRVAQLVQRFPQALDELRSGGIHLSGLFLLSRHLTEDNADALLAEARGKSKRQLTELLASWFPQPDLLPGLTALAPCPAQTPRATCPGAGNPAPAAPPGGARVEPLSATSSRVEFTASTELWQKLQHACNLLSHAEPSGDLAVIIERALDLLIAVETKRREGAGKPRKHRETKPGSRHVPVEVQRAVRKRDQNQCTFTDVEGRRCSAKRFLTIEHIEPFAKGGPTTVDNCCLLCSAHNTYRARRVFGAKHIEKKVAEARARSEHDCSPKVIAGLTGLGFSRSEARHAVDEARRHGVEPFAEPLLRAALALLTPDRPGPSSRSRA